MNNQSQRTLSGIDSDSIRHLSLPSSTSALLVGGDNGSVGQVLTKNEDTNKLEWDDIEKRNIAPNSIDGSRLKSDIGFTTSGNILMENADDNATLTADKLISTRNTLTNTDYGLDVFGNAKIGGNLDVVGNIDLEDLKTDDITIENRAIFSTNGVIEDANLIITSSTGAIDCIGEINTTNTITSTKTGGATDFGLNIFGNAKIGGDLTLTGDLELDDIKMDELTIKGKIILDSAGTGTGNTRKLDLVASSGDIIQYETFDPPNEYASIRNGVGDFRSLNTSGSIVSTEARGTASQLALSTLGNASIGGYLNCRLIQTTSAVDGQFAGNFARGIDISRPVGGTNPDIKLLGLKCQGDVLLTSPSISTDIVFEMNHLDSLGAIDKIFKIVNNDITLVNNITATGTITGAFAHKGTAIFNPSATSTESCIVFEIQTETSLTSRPSVNCNYDFFIYHTPVGDCVNTIEKVKIDTSDGDNTSSLFHGKIEIKDDDITPENIVYSFDANTQSCFLEGQITLKPNIRASPLASDEVVIQKGGVDHVVFNTGDNPTSVNTNNGFQRFKGSMYFSTIKEDKGVGATLGDAVCFGGDSFSLQTSIPIIIKDVDKVDNTGGIIFQTAEPAIIGKVTDRTKCFNLDLTDSSNSIPTAVIDPHDSLCRLSPPTEVKFPDEYFPDASHDWWNWETQFKTGEGGLAEGDGQIDSRWFLTIPAQSIPTSRKMKVGYCIYMEECFYGDDSTGTAGNRDAYYRWNIKESADSYVAEYVIGRAYSYFVSGTAGIGSDNSSPPSNIVGQKASRGGMMLCVEDVLTFPTDLTRGISYRLFPRFSNSPEGNGGRAYFQFIYGGERSDALLWSSPVPLNYTDINTDA